MRWEAGQTGKLGTWYITLRHIFRSKILYPEDVEGPHKSLFNQGLALSAQNYSYVADFASLAPLRWAMLPLRGAQRSFRGVHTSLSHVFWYFIDFTTFALASLTAKCRFHNADNPNVGFSAAIPRSGLAGSDHMGALYIIINSKPGEMAANHAFCRVPSERERSRFLRLFQIFRKVTRTGTAISRFTGIVSVMLSICRMSYTVPALLAVTTDYVPLSPTLENTKLCYDHLPLRCTPEGTGYTGVASSNSQ
ncbi:hypothetical protein B0H17DRAFT_1147426 [Mycena rosella]|uniref:Uncharacterized protein n=1 Tax=Mycena rosella TaxID=1033263 RepID=A0AAD7FZU0_MYCRO|nr:hypothetical protein B0H17DRAFT_1147426 [Mycena rosella]